MPQTDPIVKADTVKLVNDDFPTEKRELVARYIEEHWNDADNLPLMKIAEETDTSRQHVKNTLTDHFEIADPESEQLSNHGEIDADVLELIFEAYRRGYQDGRDDQEKSTLGKRLEELL